MLEFVPQPPVELGLEITRHSRRRPLHVVQDPLADRLHLRDFAEAPRPQPEVLVAGLRLYLAPDRLLHRERNRLADLLHRIEVALVDLHVLRALVGQRILEFAIVERKRTTPAFGERSL